MLLCDMFAIAPCFILTKRVDQSPVETNFNMTEPIMCSERCGKMDRVIPSYTIIAQYRQPAELLELCKAKEVDQCSFPIDVHFDHELKTWVDGDNGDKLSLPWKKHGLPLYPVMKDIVYMFNAELWSPTTPLLRLSVLDSSGLWPPLQCPFPSLLLKVPNPRQKDLTLSRRHKYWCVDLATRATTGPSGPASFINATADCKNRGMTVATVDFDIAACVLFMGLESYK